MKKNFCVLGFILCFMFMTFVAEAKDYDQKHVFFTPNFWKSASIDTVKKNLIEGADINILAPWSPKVENNHLQALPILAYAVYDGASHKVVKFLIENGATITSDALRYSRDMVMLKMLVQLGGDVNALAFDNATPILNAYAMSTPMVEFLLQQGAVPNVKRKNGDTALSLLYDRRDAQDQDWQTKVTLLEKAGAKLGESVSPKEAGIVKYTMPQKKEEQYTLNHCFYDPNFWRIATLQDVKDNVIAKTKQDPPNDALGKSIIEIALTYTTDSDIVDFLLDNGAIMNPFDYPMLRAIAQNENNDIFLKLSEWIGPYFKEENLNTFTPAVLAAEAGLKDNVAALLKIDPSIRYTDTEYGKFLEMSEVNPTAGRPDRAAVVQQIARMPVEYGSESLLFSIWRNTTVSDVQKALIQGADMNSTYRWPEGVEMLQYSDKTILEMATMRSAKPEVIEFLVKNGATITPTSMANTDDLATLKTLIKLGGDIHAVTPLDETVLLYASRNDADFVKFLLQQGVSPHIKSKNGDTVISRLHQYFDLNNEVRWEILNVLEKHGAKLGKAISVEDAGIVKYKVTKNTEQSYSFTHNYRNANFWRVATLEDVKDSFIEGENLNDFSRKSTILALAAGHTADPAIIEFLLEKGARISDNVMIYAACNRHLAILKTLLKHGGDIHANYDFHVPLSAAAEADLKEHVVFLIESGVDVNHGDFEMGNALAILQYSKGRPHKDEITKILEAAGGTTDSY